MYLYIQIIRNSSKLALEITPKSIQLQSDSGIPDTLINLQCSLVDIEIVIYSNN